MKIPRVLRKLWKLMGQVMEGKIPGSMFMSCSKETVIFTSTSSVGFGDLFGGRYIYM